MPGHRAFSSDFVPDESSSDENKAARARSLALERLAQEAVRELPGTTAKDLASPLAARALKVAEYALSEIVQSLGDRDERVRAVAARTALQMAPKLAELAPPDAPPAATPEERDAALREALESAEFCALLVRVVASPDGAARAALVEAGWLPPEG